MAAAAANAEMIRTRINGPPGVLRRTEGGGVDGRDAPAQRRAPRPPRSRRRNSRIVESPRGLLPDGSYGAPMRRARLRRPGRRRGAARRLRGDGESGRQDVAEDLGDRRIGRYGNVAREGGDQDGRRRQACDALVRRRLEGGGRREFERTGGRRGSGRFRVQAEGRRQGHEPCGAQDRPDHPGAANSAEHHPVKAVPHHCIPGKAGVGRARA